MQLQRDKHPDKRPATVDLDSQQEVITYLRALLDLHDLLYNGYDVQLQFFVQSLSRHGWGKGQIAQFIQLSSYYTRYESLVDPPIPEPGDRKTWDANYHRWRR